MMALLVIHLGLGWVGRAPGVLTAQDDANYLVLGQSLLHLSYRDEFLVSAPLHRRYPPGYPFLLAPLTALPGDPATKAIAVNLALSTVALAVAYALIRPVFGPGVALAGLAVAAVNPLLMHLEGVPRSEPLFMLLSLAALLFATRATTRTGVFAGSLSIAAALTRPVGITVVGAVALVWWLHGRRRWALTLSAAAVLLVGAWLAFSFAEPGAQAGSSYAADLTLGPAGSRESLPVRLALRSARNLPMYVASIIPGLLPMPLVAGTHLDNVAAGILTAAGLIIALVVAPGSLKVAPLYALAYLALLAIWPYQMERYAAPILPLMAGFAIGGVNHMTRPLGQRTAVAAAAVVVLVITITGAVNDANLLRRFRGCERTDTGIPQGRCLTPDQASFFTALDTVLTRTADSAVFLSAKAEPLYYYTGRRSVDLRPIIGGIEDPWGYLRRQGMTHVLLGSLQVRETGRLVDILEPHCAELALEDRFPPRTYLFRVTSRRDPGVPDGCAAIAEYRRANIGRWDEDARPR